MIEKIIDEKQRSAIRAVEQVCHRCLGHHILKKENNHLYCEDCFTNQIMTDETYLIRYHRAKPKRKHRLKMQFVLAESQKKGQAFIWDCYQKKTDGFLHAVCGAGKTEMCLLTILEALKQQQSIVFVIPRVEIIKQLIKRFRSYFPRTVICGLFQNLYGQTLMSIGELTNPTTLVDGLKSSYITTP